MALLAYHSQPPRMVDPFGSERFTLESLLYLVGEGCTVLDTIPMPGTGQIMVVDRMAERLGKPRNAFATNAARLPVRGNALICSEKELGSGIILKG